MIYEIRQRTSYVYGSLVPFSRHLLRLTPVSRPGQKVHSRRLTIDPLPSERTDRLDFFGNRVTHIAIENPHQFLEVLTTATIEADPGSPPDPAASPPWELAAEAALSLPASDGSAPAHHLYPSRHVTLHPAILDYAAVSFPPGRPVLQAGIELVERIKQDFLYDPASTDVLTPVETAFAMRRGVCQDFAHIVLSGLRALGLAAAYASGYLRTEPPPGQPRLEGVDAMHAWALVWCGPELGWQGLDPTNGRRTDTDHIILAFGRDYADVSPIDGVIVAEGGHALRTAVDVIPISATSV